MGLDGAHADADRACGLRLGQACVMLQRDRLALQPRQAVKGSGGGGLRECRGPAQLALGHQPQMGFRALAVQPHRTPRDSSAARPACTDATARNASRR
jgi:hypothetical protein